jgi:hypothetical protein
MLNMHNRFDKRTSKEQRKCPTYDPTATTSCWIPDPPEWLKIIKTTSKHNLYINLTEISEQIPTDTED